MIEWLRGEFIMSVLIEKKKRVLKDNDGDIKPHPGRRMTEAEFVAWCDDKTRAEWVDGEIIILMPDSKIHDSLVGIFRAVLLLLTDERHLGMILGPNFQVRFLKQRKRRMPDIIFVSAKRLGIVKDNFCEGAPDFAMEIVSPESRMRDLREKFHEFERAGIREYWIIDPQSICIDAYRLSEKKKYVRIEESDGKIRSAVIDGFYLRQAWMLRAQFPSVGAILRELNDAK
jgi:Uma2 family endonuclease